MGEYYTDCQGNCRKADEKKGINVPCKEGDYGYVKPKDQPAEEPKQETITIEEARNRIQRTGNLENVNVVQSERRIECDNGEVFAVSDKCRLTDYSGEESKLSGTICGYDGNGDLVEPADKRCAKYSKPKQSDAEKWLKMCDEYYKEFEYNLGTGIEYRYILQANYYCTRAMLEEIKEKIK